MTFDECFKKHIEDAVMSWDVEHSTIAEEFWNASAARYKPLVEAVQALEGELIDYRLAKNLSAALKAVKDE